MTNLKLYQQVRNTMGLWFRISWMGLQYILCLTIQTLDLPLSSSKHSLCFLPRGGRLALLIVHTTSQSGIGSKCSAVRDVVTPQTRYAVIVRTISPCKSKPAAVSCILDPLLRSFGAPVNGRDGKRNRRPFTPAILLHLTLNWRVALPKVIMPHNVLVFWERTRVVNA